MTGIISKKVAWDGEAEVEAVHLQAGGDGEDAKIEPCKTLRQSVK